MISESQPLEKKDAVLAMDGILTDQKTDIINENSIPDHPKTQYNAFRIVTAKGVVFTQSAKNTLKQIHGCRFNDCYRAFIGPITKKDEIRIFLNKLAIEAELVDIFADFGKSKKIDGLETRLSILQQEIHTSFKEFIIQAH